MTQSRREVIERALNDQAHPKRSNEGPLANALNNLRPGEMLPIGTEHLQVVLR